MKRIIAVQMISVIFLSMFQGMTSKNTVIPATTNPGVDITYEVTVTNPPDNAIAIKATYSNITSPLRLEIGYENWTDPTLSVLKDLTFSSGDGKNLSWVKMNSRIIEVSVTDNIVVANYTMNLDLTKTQQRGTKVSSIGGVLTGTEAFPVPNGQPVNSVKVKFTLPAPWKAISAFPKNGDWFEVQPYTFADLSLETKASGWFFGNVDFDQTKTYDDGFEIRVVGFKYFPYEHWNVYLGDTPVEEAIKTADFYHESYLKAKEIYGEYPLPKMLLVGPGYWQAGNTYLNQQLVGWDRTDYIPHHVLHAYFGIQGSRISLDQLFYFRLREGYTTYSEGIMTTEITGDPIWRGMLYERKFNYLRGNKFNTIHQQGTSQYVLGFIVTYLMDKEIRSETNGAKGINDLMAKIWEKYNTPNYTVVTDEQVLETLKEITGHDWYSFYVQNLSNTNSLNVDALDDLKGDFNKFLKVISDTWFNGYPSMFFVGQEIVAANGNFDQGVRLQNPIFSPFVQDFALVAYKYLTADHLTLTEQDVEDILHQVTGKDHSDFFEFYRSQGYEIDPQEITEAVKTIPPIFWGVDNAVKLTPNTFPLGKSTMVVGELVNKNFVSKPLSLQVDAIGQPSSLLDFNDLITGKGVSYSLQNDLYKLPKVMIGDKTYTFFTINMPKEKGIMGFSFSYETTSPLVTCDWIGCFIGTQIVAEQRGSTFIFKPANFNVVDGTPPVFSITDPKSSSVSAEATPFCIQGVVEPGAKVLINSKEAEISATSFKFMGCVDLLPGKNIIEVQASDPAGNTSTKEITVTLPDTTASILQNLPASNALLFILLGIVILAVGAVFIVRYFVRARRR